MRQGVELAVSKEGKKFGSAIERDALSVAFLIQADGASSQLIGMKR
jgi:hypothetical protein